MSAEEEAVFVLRRLLCSIVLHFSALEALVLQVLRNQNDRSIDRILVSVVIPDSVSLVKDLACSSPRYPTISLTVGRFVVIRCSVSACVRCEELGARLGDAMWLPCPDLRSLDREGFQTINFPFLKVEELLGLGEKLKASKADSKASVAMLAALPFSSLRVAYTHLAVRVEQPLSFLLPLVTDSSLVN